MMTNSGTFITNVVQRVVVNQMRSQVFLIMIKEKLMRVENFYLIVELFLTGILVRL